MTTRGARVKEMREVMVQTHEEMVQTPFKQLLLYQTTWYQPLTKVRLLSARRALHTSLYLENSSLEATIFGCLGQASFLTAPITPGISL